MKMVNKDDKCQRGWVKSDIEENDEHIIERFWTDGTHKKIPKKNRGWTCW